MPTSESLFLSYTSIFLNKSIEALSNDDKISFKKYLEYLVLEEKLAPREITKKLGIKNEIFSNFLRFYIGIDHNDIKVAILDYKARQDATLTEKESYYNKCQFTFSPYLYPKIIGYELLSQYQMFNAKTNTDGLHRDHMLSRIYGWENNIPPEIISHPANCAILFAKDNMGKGGNCSITLEDLLLRIENWDIDDNIFISTEVKRNRTRILIDVDSFKSKISLFNKNQRNYTDGTKNIRQHKDLPAPTGFRRGVTKKPRQLNEEQQARLSKSISKAASNQRWYTNGARNIRQNKDLPIPAGFRPGLVK